MIEATQRVPPIARKLDDPARSGRGIEGGSMSDRHRLRWVAAGAPDRPNVVIFLADDLGWGDVGFHGGRQIDTPSIDRLAREGVELHRFYATPICSPTRAALMTGRDPMRLGVAYGVIMPWHSIGIHPDEHFMPESFRAAGYQTAMVGKWHLGHAQQTYHPNQRGFEHFYGHLHTEVGYFPPFSNQGGKGLPAQRRVHRRPGLRDLPAGRRGRSRWIQARDRERPFFLYMPFIAPHTPLDAPEDLKAKYADLEDDRKPARSKNRPHPAHHASSCSCRARARCTRPWWTPWTRRWAGCCAALDDGGHRRRHDRALLQRQRRRRLRDGWRRQRAPARRQGRDLRGRASASSP